MRTAHLIVVAAAAIVVTGRPFHRHQVKQHDDNNGYVFAVGDELEGIATELVMRNPAVRSAVNSVSAGVVMPSHGWMDLEAATPEEIVALDATLDKSCKDLYKAVPKVCSGTIVVSDSDTERVKGLMRNVAKKFRDALEGVLADDVNNYDNGQKAMSEVLVLHRLREWRSQKALTSILESETDKCGSCTAATLRNAHHPLYARDFYYAASGDSSQPQVEAVEEVTTTTGSGGSTAEESTATVSDASTRMATDKAFKEGWKINVFLSCCVSDVELINILYGMFARKADGTPNADLKDLEACNCLTVEVPLRPETEGSVELVSERVDSD